MFKKFSLFLFLSLFLYANEHFYTIKLAAYKNIDSLHASITKLPKSLQKHINITHTDTIYRATVTSTTDKAALQTQLPSYRTIFSDAFIAKASAPQTSALKKKKMLKPVVASNTVKPKEKEEETKQPLPKHAPLYEKLQGKTLYMAVHKSNKMPQNMLFRVTFREHAVTYTPLRGSLPPANLQYKVEKKKLFMYRKGLFNPSIYSKLEKETDSYYLISGWMKTKKTSTVRYYFKEDEARRYLNFGT